MKRELLPANYVNVLFICPGRALTLLNSAEHVVVLVLRTPLILERDGHGRCSHLVRQEVISPLILSLAVLDPVLFLKVVEGFAALLRWPMPHVEALVAECFFVFLGKGHVRPRRGRLA
jgi:hypothetical protein